jgi:hypothetical protein
MITATKDDISSLQTQINAITLTQTAIKTASYTAAANELVKTDTTSGVVPITFPTGVADKTRIAVKMVTQGGTNATTITLSGSDVFNKAGGATSASILLLNQVITFQYEAATGIWTAIGSDTPISQLDLRYAPFPTSTTAQFFVDDTTLQGLNYPVPTTGQPDIGSSSNPVTVNFATWWANIKTIAQTFTDFITAKGFKATDTSGSGFIELPAQSSDASTPTSGLRLFANSLGKLAWKGVNGFMRIFDGTANTADRTYTLPDFDTTLAGLLGTQTFSGVKTFSPSVVAASLLGKGTTFTPTLTAAANGDVLTALEIQPTFVNGAFTGVTNIGIRYRNSGGTVIWSIDNGGTFNGSQANATANMTTPTLFVSALQARTGAGILFNTGSFQSGIIPGTGNWIIQRGGTFTDNGSNIQTTSISLAIVSKTAAYTAGVSDYTITGDATGGAFSITLPTAVGCTGRIYIIKKSDASVNAVTIATTSSQNISGTSVATTYSLASQGKYVMVQSDNVGWTIIGNN